MFPRLNYLLVILAFLSATITIRLVDPSPVSALRTIGFDFFQTLAPRSPSGHSSVRIIDIDQKSLQKIGQWPWPRTQFAKLITELRNKNAAAIGVPFVLEHPDPLSPDRIIQKLPRHVLNSRLLQQVQSLPNNDQILSKIIKKSPVIMGFTPLQTSLGTPLPSTRTLPQSHSLIQKGFAPVVTAQQSLARLTNSARGFGGLPLTEKKPYQRKHAISMLYSNGTDIFPSFTTEMLRIAQGATGYGVLTANTASNSFQRQKPQLLTGLKIGDLSLPLDENGKMLLHYQGFDKNRSIPAWKILRNGADANEIEGRLVIIGSSIPQIMPTFATTRSGTISQAELIAQSLEQILQKHFLTRPSYSHYLEVSLAIIGSLMIAITLFYFGTLTTALLTTFLIGSLIGISYYLFQNSGLLIDPIYPSAAFGLIFFIARFSHMRPAGQERASLTSIFHGKLPKASILTLTKNTSLSALEGHYATLPSLLMQFSDLETLDKRKSLSPLVHEIYSNSRTIIFENGGLVDYQSSDSLRAIWQQPGSPTSSLQTADLNAICHTAQQLSQTNTAALNHAPILDTQRKPMVHIVLSAEENWVGITGTDQSASYSMFGATSVTLNHLQAIACYYNAPVLATQIFAEKVTDIPFLPFPVPEKICAHSEEFVYILINTQKEYNPKTFQTLENLHFRLLEAIRQHDQKTAQTLMDQCLPLAGSDLAKAYDKLR